VQARDLDALRFRADTRVNAIIREVAVDEEPHNVALVDAEQILAQQSFDPGNIPGADLFYEHVHLTFDGNYLLARAVLDRVAEALPASVRSGRAADVPSKQQCAQWLALTPWDEFHMADVMAQLTAKPPFTDQLNHKTRQAAAEERVEDLRRRALTPAALGEAMRTYEAALGRRPDDWYLHNRVAHLADQCGRPDVAADHWQIVLKDFPQLNDRRILLAAALLGQGKSDEACAEYRGVVQLNPQDAEAHNGLGMALIQQGDFDTAASQFQQALELRPQYFDAQVNLGMVLGQQEKLDEAIACFLKAQEVDPARSESHINLANVLYRQGKIQEAVTHWREVVRLQPNDGESLNQLAFVLATCPIAAVRQGNDAVAFAQRAVELSAGREPVFLHTLAAAYAETGQFDKAVATAEQALDLASRQNNTALAGMLRAAIRLYHAKSPLRGLQ
jgi:tetratricopeptide (TPR) repeat protein